MDLETIEFEVSEHIATITLKAVPGAKAGTVTLTDSGFGSLMDGNGPPATPVAFSVGTLTLN